MKNKTVGIIATIASALICGCTAIIACVWGVLIATNQPITMTSGGEQSIQTLPAPVGYVLLCVSLLFVAVPVVVGFVTLRKKPEAAVAPVNNDPLPPAS